MGNQESIHNINEENLLKTEANVLQMTGLLEDQIEVKNVPVGKFEGEETYIRTFIFGDKAKPKLVMVHGYASSGPLLCCKIAKSLSEDFCVIAIDLIGMGGSSRPKNFDKHKITPEECNSYFVEYFESWRVSMGKNFHGDGTEEEFTDFYVGAHSFGGYTTGWYSVKYPQHIKKLILISPVGIRIPIEGEN